MVERVAVGRLVFGHGDQRRIIPAGTRFTTENIGLDEKEVDRLEQRGVLRRPRDQDLRLAPPVQGPGDASDPDAEVVEGRSGPAGNARSPAVQAQLAEDSATGDTSGKSTEAGGTGETAPRGGRRGKTSDLDL